MADGGAARAATAEGGLCYLDGRFLPLHSARVSVLDRGFIFGDGIYEVLPVYGGRLFALERHLRRLQASAQAIRLADPMQPGQWRSMLSELVERNGGGDLTVYLQLTRGAVYPRDHVPAGEPRPTVFAMVSPLSRARPAPLRAITLPDIRWRHCHVKSTALLANVLLRQQAADAGAGEALLLREGMLTEGAASNVFLVHAGRVCTPPRDASILGGITRDLLMEVLAGTPLAVQACPIPAAVLREASEIWVTSSTREVVPVTELDGRPVGGGEPGPCWREALQRYRDFRDASLGLAAAATG